MKALATVFTAIIAFAACGGDDGSGTGEPATGAGDTAGRDRTGATLVLNWTPNAHHLGIYAARELGWYDDVGIDLEIIEPTTAGAEQAVGTGDAAFGISVAEAVLPARAAGVPIVSLATILPVNDSALMALPDEGIDQPADLAGKTYGGFGGPLETELINRLASCGGADPSTIEHVEVGNVDYLAGLDADRYDFVWIFSGWDALRASEVEGVDVSLIRFEDHLDCIPNWYTPVVIASEQVIEEQPDIVRAFLEVTTRGYELAIDDPQRAAELMLEAVPEADADLLRAAADYYATRFAPQGAWGTQQDDVWSEFAQFLLEAGLLEERVEVDGAFTNELLPR